MKKLIILLILFFNISPTFATLNSKNQLLVKNVFTNYETKISKLSQNEQAKKVETLIQAINNLLDKYKNNQSLIDILFELKKLAQDKHNSLTSNNQTTYVESPEMKALICQQLGICDGIGGTQKIQGDLEISLNYASSKSQTIPSNGIATFGKIDFTANGNNVEVYAITLHRKGLGYARDIKRLYFEKNGVRISNIGAMSSDNTAVITFSPALIINNGSTTTLDLIGEINATSGGGEYSFSVDGATDIEANVKIVGIFPINTSSMQTGTYSTGKASITNNNTSTNYSPGKKGIEIGSFSVKTSENNGNLNFKSIKLRNVGTANLNLLWSIGLYKNNKEVSYDVSVNGRDLTINLYDTIANNSTATYKLKADMTYCKGYDEYEYSYNGDKKYKCEDEMKEYYKFEIRNAYDIEIVEEWSGFSPTINVSQ